MSIWFKKIQQHQSPLSSHQRISHWSQVINTNCVFWQRIEPMFIGNVQVFMLFAYNEPTELTKQVRDCAWSWHGGHALCILDFCLSVSNSDLDWCYSYQLLFDLAAEWNAVPQWRHRWWWWACEVMYESHVHYCVCGTQIMHIFRRPANGKLSIRKASVGWPPLVPINTARSHSLLEHIRDIAYFC